MLPEAPWAAGAACWLAYALAPAGQPYPLQMCAALTLYTLFRAALCSAACIITSSAVLPHIRPAFLLLAAISHTYLHSSLPALAPAPAAATRPAPQAPDDGSPRVLCTASAHAAPSTDPTTSSQDPCHSQQHAARTSVTAAGSRPATAQLQPPTAAHAQAPPTAAASIAAAAQAQVAPTASAGSEAAAAQVLQLQAGAQDRCWLWHAAGQASTSLAALWGATPTSMEAISVAVEKRSCAAAAAAGRTIRLLLPAVATGPRGGVQPSYRALTTASVTSMKIHDHRAYRHRHLIIAALRSSMNITHPSSPPLLLTSTSVPGCLQLFLNAINLLPPAPAPLPPTPPHPPNLATQSHDRDHASLDSILSALNGCLPSICAQDTVSVHLGSRRAVFRPPPSLPQFQSLPFDGDYTVLGLTAAVASSPCPAAGLDSSGAGLGLEPVCVVAGADGGAQVVAMRLEGWRAEQCGETGVQVVASWLQGGRRCTVQRDAQLAPGACELRLELPANLDVGPLSIHVVATDPGREGVLLGACTTMALALPAADELLALYQGDVGGADCKAGTRRLLADYAAAWQLLGTDYDGAVGATLLAGLLQYCCDSELHACRAALSKRCAAAGWLVECAMSGAAEAVPEAAEAVCAEAEGALPTGGGGSGGEGPVQAERGAGAASAASTSSPGNGAGATDAAPGFDSGAARTDSTGTGAAAGSDGSKCSVEAKPGACTSYAEWKQRLARRLDLMAPRMYAVPWALMVYIVSCKTTAASPAPLVVALLTLHIAVLSAPHLLMTLCGARFQAHRTALFVLQSVARCVLLLPACVPGVSLPRDLLVSAPSVFSTVAVHGVFRPVFQQVSWRMQALTQALEMACRVGLVLSPRCTCGAEAHPTPAIVRSIVGTGVAVVLASALTCELVERWAWASYARFARCKGCRACMPVAGKAARCG